MGVVKDDARALRGTTSLDHAPGVGQRFLLEWSEWWSACFGREACQGGATLRIFFWSAIRTSVWPSVALSFGCRSDLCGGLESAHWPLSTVRSRRSLHVWCFWPLHRAWWSGLVPHLSWLIDTKARPNDPVELWRGAGNQACQIDT